MVPVVDAYRYTSQQQILFPTRSDTYVEAPMNCFLAAASEVKRQLKPASGLCMTGKFACIKANHPEWVYHSLLSHVSPLLDRCEHSNHMRRHCQRRSTFLSFSIIKVGQKPILGEKHHVRILTTRAWLNAVTPMNNEPFSTASQNANIPHGMAPLPFHHSWIVSITELMKTPCTTFAYKNFTNMNLYTFPRYQH